MSHKADFLIGLALGAVAGVFGYKFMQAKAKPQEEPAASGEVEVPMDDALRRRKEDDSFDANEAMSK